MSASWKIVGKHTGEINRSENSMNQHIRLKHPTEWIKMVERNGLEIGGEFVEKHNDQITQKECDEKVENDKNMESEKNDDSQKD